MRAAFSPPPKRVQEQAKPQEQTSEPEAGIAQPVSAQEQPADSSNKGAEEGGAEPGSNPMFGAESSSEEAGKVAGPQTPQPLLKSGESEMVQLAKPNVINPSLLEPMDTIPPEVAEIQPQEQPGQEYTTANGGSHPLSTPEPPTPSQVRQRRLETAPSSFGSEERRRRRSKGGGSSRSSGRQRGTDRHLGGLDGEAGRSLDEETQRQAQKMAKSAMLKSGDSGRMQGQDTLEVRSVTLANGQKASLILEEGRLQRIVAANGQVAELRWRPPSLGRVAGPQRQLSVKLHRGVSPPRDEDSRSSQVMPATIRRWANSLNSQRLTTGPSATYHKNSLYSAPSGLAGLDSQDSRGIKSLEIGSPDASTYRRKSFMQSLFSLPASQVKTASQGDMPTIMETSREVRGDWNPIHESWLPSAMTTQFLGGTPPLSGTEPPKQEDAEKRKLRIGESVGRSVDDRKKLTQSVDANMNTPEAVQAAEDVRPARASIGNGEAFRLNATLYDSDPGPALAERKKISFWKVLKRMLHFPSITKPRSPKAPTPDATATASARRASYFTKRSKRFSFGTGRRSDVVTAKEAAKYLPEQPAFQSEQRLQSMSDLPRLQADLTTSSRPEARPHSRSAQDMPAKLELGPLSGRTNKSDMAIPATPQQPEPAMRRATDNTPLPSARRETSAAPAKEAPDAARSLNSRMENAGDLIDTAELRAALSQRKAARDGLLSQTSGLGDEKSSRGRRRRPLDTEGASLNKQRTMMGGKWQKNFTEGTSGAKVDELLQVSSLQRLARERIVEMEIVETEETFELVWHIPLNGSASKISKTDRYLKNGEVVEAARRDGRPGVLRSQLTFTPEGHVHIRALQGEPFSAVFHDRIKLSTGGRRIKIEQKFQLLQPGVLPVKYYSIWNRVE